MSLRLCHSIWTKPVFQLHSNPIEILKMNMWFISLSVSYARKLNATIVLHTDDIGKRIFEYLPYDEIYTSLTDIETSEYFWAAGKIKAQFLEPLGSVHIDGDVFLKKEGLNNLIVFGENDVLVQSEESINEVYLSHIEMYRRWLGKSKFQQIFTPPIKAYNCGLIGFNNEVLKDNYIKNYNQLVGFCSANKNVVKYMAGHTSTFIPDIIAEQMTLPKLVKEADLKVKFLLPNDENMQYEAIKIGYTHVLGGNKFAHLDKVKERLLEVDKELFYKTKAHIDTLSWSKFG